MQRREVEKGISEKLKAKLKNIKVNAEEEHEQVIEIYLEMEYLITRITSN